jgi:hypothetical protein
VARARILLFFRKITPSKNILYIGLLMLLIMNAIKTVLSSLVKREIALCMFKAAYVFS